MSDVLGERNCEMEESFFGVGDRLAESAGAIGCHTYGIESKAWFCHHVLYMLS